MKMGKYKYVIWDWNGTLLNDVKINYEVINKILADRNFKTMKDIEEYKSILSFPVRDCYEKMGFDLGKEKFEDIARDYAKEYESRFFESELYPEVEGVLREVLSLGLEQLIISASEQEMLLRQVESFGIDHLFTEILGTGDVYAGGKVGIALGWFKNSTAKKEEILFVGDTDHDYEVSKSIGCDCLLIPNGHCTRDRLLICDAEIGTNLNDVISKIK